MNREEAIKFFELQTQDEQALIDGINLNPDDFVFGAEGPEQYINDCQNNIDAYETAISALRGPVPNRGEWAVKKFPDEENGERFEMEFFVCSICGNKILWGFMRTDFCSQCGADMRGPCAENRRKEK